MRRHFPNLDGEMMPEAGDEYLDMYHCDASALKPDGLWYHKRAQT